MTGGGVVREDILKRYPKDRYVCFSVGPRDQSFGGGQLPTVLQGVPFQIRPLEATPRLRGARFYLPVLRALGFRVLAPWRIRQAVGFGRRHRIDLVWADLQGEALLIAAQVAQSLGVPLVGSLWDDPEGWLRDGGYDRLARRLLWKRFRQALRQAWHLSTAGEAMQEAYEKEYGIKSVILRHGFDRPVFPTKMPRDANGIIIGFVGNAYGPDAWQAFLAAAAQINAGARTPRIKVRAFGPGVPYRSPGVEMEDRGWQPTEAMLQEIAKTDFCYLPYWFEPQKRRHVELSFPNKFETYLAAGRPVLFHGPAYAGIAQTIRQYGVGLCVHSLDEAEITGAVERLILDNSLKESCSRAALAAFHAEFNATKMIANFAELIGIDPDMLLPEKVSSLR